MVIVCSGDKRFLEPLIEVTRTGGKLRGPAVSALRGTASANRDDPDVIGPVRTLYRAALADPDPDVRSIAAFSLGIVGEEEDLRRLRALLDDPHRVQSSRRRDGKVTQEDYYPVRSSAKDGVRMLEPDLKAAKQRS